MMQYFSIDLSWKHAVRACGCWCMGHALGVVIGCVICIGCEVGCIWYGEVMRLIVGFG